MEAEQILKDHWRKFRLGVGLDPNEEMSPKAIENFTLAMEVYNESSLLKFVESLQNRGLLSKSMEEMDYEWVIWDYLANKTETKKSP